ncbi:uncharacterized protein Sse isoform X2 [Halyomorpha halys]|uniref:uncharacterized protein Sse isoform X2 n=1 Tax=Halyomorpha halys TaxID=286706 RepID=UPI0006D503A5|nr:separase isoform X2 [Halyomorpha halys]
MSEKSDSSEKLSFHSHFAREGVNGMLKRLEEMPPEWTIIQLTRAVDPNEYFSIRQPNYSPKLKDFFLTRFPCGNELKKSIPVCTKLSWPEDAIGDLIQSFLNIKEKLGQRKGTSAHIQKMRNEASSDVERLCREIGPMCFKEWSCLTLGKLMNKALEEEIREAVDKRIGNANISIRQRYLCYLIGEGSCHLENGDIEVALYQVFEGNETLAVSVLECLIRIKETLESRLHVAARHPVLLVLDDHFDNISWECTPLLKRHPVSRVFSLHVAHALFTSHKDHIKGGLREINESEVCYYVVNPDGNLPSVEEHIPKFFRKRFPQWVGIIGKKPTEEELIKALTESNTYVYCGHGSGSQYIASERIQRLKVKPLQMLFGCSSVALKDLGGHTEMYGDVMEFAIACSGCTLGMLWPVTCHDTDRITMVLANICLPGTPVDTNTFEEVQGKAKKEPELLRAMRQVRECVNLFSNGAALIARGIPIKLVPDKTTTSSDFSSDTSESK